jgi:hypothetical protein
MTQHAMLWWLGGLWASTFFGTLMYKLPITYILNDAIVAKQNRWKEDCAKAWFNERYKEECAEQLLANHGHWFEQWMRMVFFDFNWCGINNCEVFFTLKGMFYAALLFAALFGGEPVVKNAWKRMSNRLTN